MPKEKKIKEETKEEIIENDINLLEEMEEKLKEANNKILIAQAELINYRKRKDEEVSSTLKYANKDLILELLPVLDNFERAIVLDDNDLSDELSKFLAGFKMIYAALVEIIKGFGVQEIYRLGEKFDPNLEEGLLIDNDLTKEDEVVLDVLRKGYILHDRVLRPAQVKVNKLEKENE